MKVVHISTSDTGGAGAAAVRLHLGLRELGVHSSLLVLKSATSAPGVARYKPIWSKFLLLAGKIFRKAGVPISRRDKMRTRLEQHRRNYEMFSFAETTYTNLHNHPLVRDCDVINLHWVANFLDYKTFFSTIGKPVIWTLHDMNPFQGSFHYYEDQLRNAVLFGEADKAQYLIKKDAYGALPVNAITVVTPSEWLSNLSGNSELLGRFEHRVINNGIDTNIFSLAAQHEITTNVRQEKIVVLFVSEFIDNIRKGFQFIATLLLDPDVRDRCEFVAIGHTEPSDRITGVRYMGIISEEEVMSEMYNAADIFLLPSREDNLPNVMIESLCCGTPVVAFNTGGIAEVVTNGVNGYLSDELSSAGLSRALADCINHLSGLKGNRAMIAADAQRRFGVETQASRYKSLYHVKSGRK